VLTHVAGDTANNTESDEDDNENEDVDGDGNGDDDEDDARICKLLRGNLHG